MISSESETVTPSSMVTTTMASTRPSPSTTPPATNDPAPSDPLLPAGWSVAVVVDVIDGDTIAVRLDEDGTEVLRLIGTNSPEDGECFADEAAAGLRGLLHGETVYLEPDVSDRDQFGRLLRYVWTIDDQFVNAMTVETGWAIARDYPPDISRSEELEKAQQRAQTAGAGLWAPEACGSALAAEVRIVDVEYDAPGNDNFNLNGEWVEIVNGGEAPVDLTGWVLKDESATHRYSFPAGFSLHPAGLVRVFTGCGPDTSDALYWCVTGSAVWNNDGDTAFLLDSNGNIVFSYPYG